MKIGDKVRSIYGAKGVILSKDKTGKWIILSPGRGVIELEETEIEPYGGNSLIKTGDQEDRENVWSICGR